MASFTAASGRVSDTTRFRPAWCSENTVARSARVPTIDPITEVPFSTVSKTGMRIAWFLSFWD